MEDAVDALKMAFAVFIFVLALSIVFIVFSQAREVSEIVLKYSDNTYFASYINPDNTNTNGRVVGIETVIPTLYRYYKEKFSVDIVANGVIEEKFDEEIERKVYRRLSGWENYEDYYKDKISWLARPNEDIKKRVTGYISGNTDKVNGVSLSSYSSKNLKKYKDRTFIETFRQVDTTPEGSKIVVDGSTIYLQTRGTKKNYITYTVN